MAINPLLPILIGAMQTRNVIKDQNEAEYDEVTGAFIDAAATEFFADKATQKKRIENNEKFYKATENRYGTNVAEFSAKSNLFEGYNSPLEFLRAIEEGQAMPIEFRNKLRGTTKDGKIDDTFFKSQGFKTTFAEDTNLARQQLEDKTLFAAKNLNKGAISNLADLYLGDSTQKQSPLKTFLFGQKTPNVTKMAAGFEAGLDATAEKSVVKPEETTLPEETTSVADASSLAADTNLIDQKLGFEKNISIGSVREVDSAIASIFDITGNVELTSDGVVFPTAYKFRALAIKDIAANFAQSGKYEGDTSKLISDAANYIEQEYFSTLPKAFGMYEMKSQINEPVFATATFAIDQETNTTMLGDSFKSIFNQYADNPETDKIEELLPKDLVLKRRVTEMTTKRGVEQTARSEDLMMTEAAYQAIKNFIQDMESTSLQKAYIQYLPKNLAIDVGGNVVPISNRLDATFGFTRF